ncbi:MAG: hypothetical protein E7157_01220 [Lactobacillales bacterium]|nr:hypothetical protein [Lactobacillales bacterium]
MDDNERIVRIEDLKKFREEILKEVVQTVNTEETSNQENITSKTKKMGVGNVTGGLNMYPEHEEKKTGMINVITLSILSFIFEVLFIYLSIIIFK